VLATTNRQLQTEVAAGRFRADLYYRLNVFPLALSPLRARREDILPLAMQLLASHCRPGERIPALSAEAAQKLLTHSWPGNVRELDNVMQRALILINGGSVIGADAIQVEEGMASAVIQKAPEVVPQAVATKPQALSDSLSNAERDLILDALRANNGNRRAVAQRLGISERTLRYKLARLREAGVAV
jgi:two-component system response regulator FlrC